MSKSISIESKNANTVMCDPNFTVQHLARKYIGSFINHIIDVSTLHVLYIFWVYWEKGLPENENKKTMNTAEYFHQLVSTESRMANPFPNAVRPTISNTAQNVLVFKEATFSRAGKGL